MHEQIYISGKIKDYDSHKEHFRKAELFLKDKFPLALRIVNPVKIGDRVKLFKNKPNYKDFLDADIEELKSCTHIYMLKNWWKSLGAKTEFSYAQAVGLEIMHEGDELDKVEE